MILFLDIETVPTPEALEAAGEVNDEAIKKLSLCACTESLMDRLIADSGRF